MQVSVIGVPELQKALAAVSREAVAAADRGLQRAGLHIIADAQENLRKDQTNTTGRLSQSGKVVKSREAAGGYDVGFMSQDKSYAGAVEYGRRPGRIPPPDEMAAWAYKKLHLRDWREARAIGWGAAVNIGRHGTKGKPYFQPALAKNHTRILSEVRDAVMATLNRTNK